MALSAVKTVILYLAVVSALRLMGKRQVGELQPSELVVAIMISEIASVPMQSKDVPLLDGIVPIFTLVLLELIFSILVLKSEALRRLFSGSPGIVVRNGKIVEKELRRMRINIDDLLEELRLSGYCDLSEVESALLETNGQVSIIPKASFRPLTPSDMKIQPKQQYLSHTVISDGILRRKNLAGAGVDETWLYDKLSCYNITDIKQVFYMSVSDDKKIFLQLKE